MKTYNLNRTHPKIKKAYLKREKDLLKEYRKDLKEITLKKDRGNE